MFFLRFFIIVFFFSSGAIALSEQDWIEDRDAISSTLTLYREHYLAQSLNIEKVKRKSPVVATPWLREMVEGWKLPLIEQQEACRVIYTLGSYQALLERTPYDIGQIVRLLKFPFEQIGSISQCINSSKNEGAKNIYEEALGLMTMIHYGIQQYFQEKSDHTQSKLGFKTEHEELKEKLTDLDYKNYLKEKIAVEKSMFWLPSHQRHVDFYNEEIKKLESELRDVKERLSAQEVKKSVGEDPKKPKLQPQENVTLVEASRVQPSPFPAVQASAEGVQDLSDALEKKSLFPTAAEEEGASTGEDEISSAVATVSLEASEYETIQRDLALQYERDRAKKLSKKQPAGAAASLLEEEQPTAKVGTAEEDIKDHPTLKQIFSLDTNLKYEKFLGFLKSLSLRMEERIGGLVVWFDDEMCKIFHRPHVQGNVVPFIDLTVAKRALKHINITPSFGK